VFFAAPAGGYDFTGTDGEADTGLDLSASPAGAAATSDGNLSGQSGSVQGLTAGLGSSTTHSFSGIQSFVGTPEATTTVVNDAATQSPWSGHEVSGASAYAAASVGHLGGIPPTGSMTYYLFADGSCSGTPLTTQQVALSAGNAPNSASTASLEVGTYSFSAAYSGDGTYQPSASGCERFAVPGPPSATITAPDGNQTYNLGQSVPTAFSCAEGVSGPGIATCADSNGGTGTSGHLDTSSAGEHTYTVTAASIEGQHTTAALHYSVLGAPTETITSPTNGATYRDKEVVQANFSCADAPGGPGIKSAGGCVGSAANGARVATSVPGRHAFTVTATSSDGQTSSTTVHYTVSPPPAAVGIVTSAARVSAVGLFSVKLRCGSGRADARASSRSRSKGDTTWCSKLPRGDSPLPLGAPRPSS
jgi:hypothetical protein